MMAIIIRLAETDGRVLLVDVMHACIYGSCVGGSMHRQKKTANDNSFRRSVTLLVGPRMYVVVYHIRGSILRYMSHQHNHINANPITQIYVSTFESIIIHFFYWVLLRLRETLLSNQVVLYTTCIKNGTVFHTS